MSLPLNQPFLRSVFCHFTLFQPFLKCSQVWRSISCSKVSRMDFSPENSRTTTKRTLFFCCLLFSIGYLHRVAGQTAAPATKSGNEPLKTCKLPSGLQILLSKFS